ncbi:methylenetetrahydrofolate--tRNA-(uracil(54)-C(5))-methyltransferase (FADH(2)-oxidizing) TrmFO [Tumebacillus algifaecis]|uniref:Methylenetetrahydrofolate--tRNA-(uracil-5-)-methyltransferase TrmFO n=1 Tax=Tumebacillus algifaecis TaxID=1214604 RepID=A0A223D1X4_9BACL|nr:FADH(2)-oxidizing methylenetetrahydrofolate--tRNA-(uracil(54)-C(5))-methyltransferase TrmFO [Tumebacillus algifaecis]ASS75658.1 methylenetetrahydrofolate--tRNA-(uracil(54)-C(5))-methyltransferase (FADH(2)-oxidizing) TrmFO [Tumebacillus algifaecis]
MTQPITVIGAGLAGSEAAWQIAKRGHKVNLYEMRPVRATDAHKTENFAELVCSNSLRGASLTNAVGLLKEEMRRLDSVIISSADRTAVPAGGALAVDRDVFSGEVTRRVMEHPNINVIRDEVTEIPQDGIVIIASGPLTSPMLSKAILEMTGEEYLYFYDAAAPIINKESINFEKAYIASRYDKGEAAYINCPLTEEEYNAFYEALITAEVVPLKEFEKEIFFEGCMPVEVMATRGRQTMLFGPLKPVGLPDPRTGKEPFAVVQLRQDNASATLYNMVGFQTHLKWGDQSRVFQMIPGLENAEIVRFGVMHRNTYINSPNFLRQTYQTQTRDTLFFAGQITGVEGYVESAAAGLIAGINASRLLEGQEPLTFPRETAIGSLAYYITHTSGKNFQPMNATFGLLPPLEKKIRNKMEKNEKISARALDRLQAFTSEHQL